MPCDDRLVHYAARYPVLSYEGIPPLPSRERPGVSRAEFWKRQARIAQAELREREEARAETERLWLEAKWKRIVMKLGCKHPPL